MNTNSNTYTVIYSTILVVVVAAVLAFAATSLKEKQDENVKVDTISQILTAADIKYTESDVLDVYIANIEKAILVNAEGKEVGTLNTADAKSLKVYGNPELKAQIAADEKNLPVYIFKNGIVVVPCYGAGLWGPIWGYIGIKEDLTIQKACFGHKGETPGLGAKITDMPEVFADKFAGKTITAEILVAKNVTGANDVNAISGATITSTAAGVMVNQWLGFYKSYFGEAQSCCADCQECCTECCAETEQCTEDCCAAEEVAVEESNN
jgi:Na+-transporting NADH:ubiquinone oxidoreductase subunit C